MFIRRGQMPPEEVFTRTLFGIILISAAFVRWGSWVSLGLGILFIISALSGVCLTCILYKKFFSSRQ